MTKRHDRHELRSAILKVMTEGGTSTKRITALLPVKVSEGTVRKHLRAMAAEGYVQEGWLEWSFPYRGKEHVGTLYQTPERKLFEAAADLIAHLLENTPANQKAHVEEVRDALLHLMWMEDEERDHGLTLQAAPALLPVRFGQTVPRYVIADAGEEALFKIGKT